MMTRENYGEGSLYQRASDWRWFAAIEAGFNRDGSRRRITVSSKGCVGGCKPRCPHRAEIKRKLKLKQRTLDRGDTGTSPRTTVKTWADKWLAETVKHVTPNAHTTDLAAAGWIIEAIGARALTQLTPADIRAVRDAVTGAGRSTSTALRYHGTLMRMLEAARQEGYPIPDNVLNVRPPKAAISDRTAMTVEEALAVLEVASTLPHGSRWLAAFLMGAPRINEANGLTWPLVQPDSVALAWQLQPLPYRIARDPSSGFRVPDGYENKPLQGALNLVRPKSRAGWRIVPLVPMMGDALDRWRTIAPSSPHGLVWPTLVGAPANENADRDEWRAIQATAGVGHPEGRYYHVHEIRHTAATLLMALGIDEATRIAIMGHSAITSTRAYEHRDLTLIRAALDKYADKLRAIG